MTTNQTLQDLEKLYGLKVEVFSEEKTTSEGNAFLEIIKVDDEVLVTNVGDHDFAQTSGFKAWRSAHRAMLKACEVEDYSCAIQDLKEAQDFAKGQLETFYSYYKDKIMRGLKGNSV